MKLGVHIGYWGLGLTSEDQLQHRQEAERLGYDSVWAAEAYGSDTATVLGWLAGQTSKIRLGSGIFQMPARSAAMTAMTAATIDQLSNGRMICGIGSSGPQVAEGWHGQRFAKQLQRTREYVAVVRMALARERVEFKGETLELPLPDGPGKALKLTISPVQARIPIYLAAIGPKNTALAGEIADGWIPTLFSPEHVSEHAPAARGRRRAAPANRWSGFDIAPSVSLCIGDDIEAARNTMRPFIALYVGGMGSREQNFYNQVVQRYGYEAEAQGDPEPLPRRQARGGDGGDPRLAHRRGVAVRAQGRRPRAHRRLPRRGRRHARRDAHRVHRRGAPRAAAAARRARRLSGVCMESAARQPLRLLLGAFGDPGHAFPMIALGCALRARGHEVTLQTWTRWRHHVEAEGLAFAAAPEYQVFPTGPEPLDFYEAVVHATVDTQPLVRELRPHAVVADILTLAPALAAELELVPRATLIPHVYPHGAPGFPIYSLGARLPRTAAGRAFWRRASSPVQHGLERGRVELNRTRAQLGLPALAHVHGGISRELALVATFPQLEYPRRWPAHVHVVGPLMWEPPAADVELPPGEEPLVLVAPSTAQDSEHTLLSAALRGLANAPVRVLATWNRRLPSQPLPVPGNARLVEWVSYSRTMPRCDVVVCHAGHGTLARALACGCAVVACPAAGDMNENAARLDWAGAGVRIPRRFLSPRTLRLAVERALSERSIRAHAQDLAGWSRTHDAGVAAASLVEDLASRSPARSAGVASP